MAPPPGRHRPQCSVDPVLALMARFPTGRGTVAILVEARSLPGAVRTRSARRSRRGAVLRRQPTDVQGQDASGGQEAAKPPLSPSSSGRSLLPFLYSVRPISARPVAG